MKNFNLKELVLAVFVFAVAIVLPQEAFSALATSDLASHLPALFSPEAAGGVMTGLAFVSLVNIDGSSEGQPNPGGTRNLYIIARKDFDGVWPKAADIVDGEITVAPKLFAGKKFAEYEFPDGTFELADDGGGDPGFQSYKHTADFMLAGFDKKLVAELRKHLNTASVIIGELNDGQLAVIGSSDNGIYLKPSFKSGKKGNDKRGYTIKGEQDGFMWGVMPLKAEIAAALPLLSAPVQV
ncbi:hypothetical protein [Siphonobacter sp. SORGH_AS_0500]|uniref:hypothetical protein n=1 Tax=Siphonobacter sp. SORGH_AS_0500 TaxID=1864824 RepID=UPI002855B6A0|nr:hypothetical protein [Siphonobacter sp. SORGH_AS_0500]MDR6195184.1 hypothetical protein [Siphonobacter sp. SORGH_AS_0500]